MFNEFYSNIELTDAEIYFLAKELNLQQIIGLGFDYQEMNTEMKNAVKQESYDLFEKQGALQMNFSGKTMVNDEYADIVKSFEHPVYCGIVQHIDICKKASSMRKVYLNDGVWTALDYIEENVCCVYRFPDKNKSNSFLFANINIDAVEDFSDKQVVYSSIDKLSENSTDILITTEYILKNDVYEAIQQIYAKLNNGNWYFSELVSDETNIILSPVTELVKIC